MSPLKCKIRLTNLKETGEKKKRKRNGESGTQGIDSLAPIPSVPWDLEPTLPAQKPRGLGTTGRKWFWWT